MPSYVLRAAPSVEATRGQSAIRDMAAAPLVAVPRMVPRSCELQPYTKRQISNISLAAGTKVIAYASPDSTFAVTKKLIDAAQRSILIGIYDFSAPHMREVLLAALARGVSISLMLDIDSANERREFDRLVEMGVRGVSAPSCANDSVRLFSSSHEKVIVIDDEWCLVQSGNYSSNSIPLNETDSTSLNGFRTGNRDSGLAIRSRKLAALFTEILEGDMAAVTAVREMLMRPAEEAAFLVERAPRRPTKRFKSKMFTLQGKLTTTPVVSPDNYMEIVPGLLSKARSSVLIEQQYIKAGQRHIRTLLDSIKTAREKAPNLDVRIVLGKVFDKSALKAERKNLETLTTDFGLKLGANIRYVNTDQFVHCHNKMVLIDGEGVLVSSQNWSDSAVSKNREAGVWLRHKSIARYFTAIFDHDWSVAFKKLPDEEGEREMLAPEALRKGGFVQVERADYEEV